MYYVQFYQKPVIWREGQSADPIEACGDRAVIILDGRERLVTHLAYSRDQCVKRGFVGFRLYRGESFTRSKATTGYFPVAC